MEPKSKTCWGQGLNLTEYFMSHEPAIAMGVVSRKLTPYEHSHRPTDITSNPSGAEEISSCFLFCFVFSLPEFSGKEENYKTRSLCIP